MHQIATLTAIFLIGSECSRVTDLHNQQGLYISDYCPKIGICGEGSHVMCLYNPSKIRGPACYDYVDNVTITPEYAQIILGVTNRIRSKIANGQVKLKQDGSLPRGYGMLKVVWDEELATFAQVWANQCILRGDLCRSSKRFPDVGQAVGMTRLSVSNWMPIHEHNFTSTTLTPDKVKYSIISIIRAWWEMKRTISYENVNKSIEPDLGMLHNKFLNLIYGPLTHMGCGISVYKEYSYKDNNAHLNFNCIQVVCNFSSRPKLGQPVYTVEPPSKPGYTVRCGCPVGYDEDESCLCYESGRKLPCKDKSACRPALVVLPIFTTEDAPPSMIGIKNGTYLRENTNEIFDGIEDLNNQITYNQYSDIFNGLKAGDHKSDLTRRFPADVKSRYFSKESKVSKVNNTTKVPNRFGHFTQTIEKTHFPRKQSIFANVQTFQLPIKKRKQLTMDIVHHAEEFKKDVAPRKDFVKVQKLASSYLDKKRSGKSFDFNLDRDDYISHKIGAMIDFNSTAKTNKKIKENSKDIAKYSEEKFVHEKLNLTEDHLTADDLNKNGEGDKKLISLLNNLEQVIKNTDLNTNEKTIFDDKFRKIYESLVGKPDLLRQKYKLTKSDSTNETNDLNKIMKIDQMYLDKNDIDLNKLKYRNEYNDFEKKPVDSAGNYENYLEKKSNGNKFDTRNTHRNNKNVDERRFRNIHDVRMSAKSHYRNRHSGTEGDENYTLNNERRRYYQEKLANLQNQISNMNRSGHQKTVPEDRQMRPVRPTKGDFHHRRKPNDQVNTYYMPDRARFLHGF